VETAVGIQISLNSLGEGFHTVSVIGKDIAGHWQSEANPSTAIWEVDTTAPTGTMSINDGDAYSTAANVLLDLNITDAEDMCFSNDDVTFSDWEAYAHL
jgi:hypothetical protein